MVVVVFEELARELIVMVEMVVHLSAEVPLLEYEEWVA